MKAHFLSRGAGHPVAAVCGTVEKNNGLEVWRPRYYVYMCICLYEYT